MGLEAEAKSGWEGMKKNWMFFLLVGVAVMVGVLWYDHKNSGSLTTKVAGWPVIGKLFA